jgi:hypothetical protein
MLDFILGAAFMFFFLFIPAVLNVNPRDDDYRTQKSKGSQNHKVWEKEERIIDEAVKNAIAEKKEAQNHEFWKKEEIE